MKAFSNKVFSNKAEINRRENNRYTLSGFMITAGILWFFSSIATTIPKEQVTATSPSELSKLDNVALSSLLYQVIQEAN